MTGLQHLEAGPSVLCNIASDRNRSHRRRKVHHKVKTGCKACKLRRQKCDERKPICSSCSRYSTECRYQNDAFSQSEARTSRNATSVTVFRPSNSAIEDHLLSLPLELNLGDLELFHQFLTSTCIATAQKPEVTAHIQKTVVPLAQSYPFVMRGLLAKAAIHLSRLRPSRHAYYTTMALRNHTVALPAFQAALSDINEDNCHALISYSKNLLWCSLAGGEFCDQTEAVSESREKWLPQWFYLLHGSCRIVESSRAWIKEGPHVYQDLDSALCYSNNSDDHQILLLMSQLPHQSDSVLCGTVISALRESFARASMHHHNTPYRNAINFWITSLSDEYIGLLQKKEPWALVILAYFCVLFHRSETVWFMKGHATRLLLLIIENLDRSWTSYLQWPCEELGLELTQLVVNH